MGWVRFLSSDLLEGRAPATRGGRLTVDDVERVDDDRWSFSFDEPVENPTDGLFYVYEEDGDRHDGHGGHDQTHPPGDPANIRLLRVHGHISASKSAGRRAHPADLPLRRRQYVSVSAVKNETRMPIPARTYRARSHIRPCDR